MPSNEGPNVVQHTPKVLVIGCSYAGLATTVNLLDLCDGKPPRFSGTLSEDTAPTPKLPVDITIVDERDGYYHLIGNPLAFASEEAASKSWTRFRDIPALQLPNVHFIQGSVANVDCEKKVASIVDTSTKQQRPEKYDYLVVASGLRRTFPVVPQALNRDDFLSEAKSHIKAIREAKEGVVVIGGGAVGIEMASEIKHIFPSQKVTLIHSRAHLLSSEPLPNDFKDLSLSMLQETGVEVITSQRVVGSTPLSPNHTPKTWTLTLENGDTIQTSHVVTAISKSTPTSSFLPSCALDDAGFVKITPSLHFPSSTPHATSHFAAGDTAAWTGIKRCGGAMHMGHYVAINLHQTLLSKHFDCAPRFKELTRFPNVMALAVGNKAVVFDEEEGTRAGVELGARYFGADLGNTICWNYMKLGQAVVV